MLEKVQVVLIRTAIEIIPTKKNGSMGGPKLKEPHKITKTREFLLVRQLVKLIGMTKSITRSVSGTSHGNNGLEVPKWSGFRKRDKWMRRVKEMLKKSKQKLYRRDKKMKLKLIKERIEA